MPTPTAPPGPTPALFTPDAWAWAIICNPSIKRSAEHVAWLISSDPHFATDGCRADDADIAARLRLAPNSVKNALLILRAGGFVRWSRTSIGGTRVRTIRPHFPREETACLRSTMSPGDILVATSVATPSQVGHAPLPRAGQSPSYEEVYPVFEALAGQAHRLASPGGADTAIADAAFDRTHTGCDTGPSLEAHDLNGDVADAVIGAGILPMFPDPLSVNSTQTGSNARPVQEVLAPRRSRRRYDPTVPLWVQPADVQHARAAFHTERLSGNARCTHDGCGSHGIAFVCAEEGSAFCSRHGGYALHPVALAAFDLDRRR